MAERGAQLAEHPDGQVQGFDLLVPVVDVAAHDLQQRVDGVLTAGQDGLQ
jgi:hypothetical protein